MTRRESEAGARIMATFDVIFLTAAAVLPSDGVQQLSHVVERAAGALKTFMLFFTHAACLPCSPLMSHTGLRKCPPLHCPMTITQTPSS